MSIEKSALIDVLTHPDSVLFVGSGISTWSSLPNWNQLILGLIAACERRGGSTRLARDALGRGDLLDATDKLADIITPLEIATVLRNDLGFERARPHNIHRLITNLGPQRFVTTNFDNLIEQQLGLEGRLGEFRTVTNRQIAELADIQKASATRFVFKPHGDIADAESLVLSTAHYDRILLGGSNLVRPVLETLFVSRPILFIGYGLRDPDTLLLLRALKERYNGNAGEFYAIFPEAGKELADYFWRQYRLRIYGYPTNEGVDNHSVLFDVLQSLSDEVNRKSKSRRTHNLERKPDDNRHLIRYAARLVVPTTAVSFSIRILISDWHNSHRIPYELRRFHGSIISDLLMNCADSFILQGPAGSGKSFAISDRLARAGKEIIDWCLDGSSANPPPIPVLLDARLYKGDFASLIASTVPASLDLVSVSQTHKIVLIVDSLDEMPAKHLDSGHWRSSLELLTSTLKNSCVQFGTRRADLVSDPSLPIFVVEPLLEEIVVKNLEELGRKKDELTPDLFEALKTPFTLTLGRRLLGLNMDISSTPALFSKLLDQALVDATGRESASRIFDSLSELASEILASGYDTIPLAIVTGKLGKAFRGKSTLSKGDRWLLDRLVDARIFVSEIDSHVRFIHRSVAEFLAAFFLVKAWRGGDVELSEVLSIRRWDNAVAWASTLLTEGEGRQFLQAVYSADPEVAALIARAAEVGKSHIWSTLFELLVVYPPTDEEAYSLIESIGDATVPDEALAKLRPLTNSNTEIGGWAAALLVDQMSDLEVGQWIGKIFKGEIDFNFLNFFGASLGARIGDSLLASFMSDLEAWGYSYGPSKEEQDNVSSSVRHGMETVIRGFSKNSRDNLLKWSRNKSNVVRGVICNAVREIDDDLSVPRYIASQLDRGVSEAIFSLYLALRYHDGTWEHWTLPYSSRRLEKLVGALNSDQSGARWILELLRCLIRRDMNWRIAVMERAKVEKDTATRRVLRALLSTKANAAANQIFLKALKPGAKLSSIEQQFCHLLHQYELDLNERQILNALKTNARSVLKLLDDTFFRLGQDRLPLKVSRPQEWIALLNQTFTLAEWTTDFSLGVACGYLAKAIPISDHKEILRLANDPKSPVRDFVLGLIIPRVTGITTDDLSPVAANRLLDLYVKGHLEPLPSPGEIATERFITEIVLPYAKSIEDDSWERQAIEQVLMDAGRRHDRRYYSPWKRASPGRV